MYFFAGTKIIFCFIGCRALKCSCRFCWHLSLFLLEAFFDFASTDHRTSTWGEVFCWKIFVASRFFAACTRTRRAGDAEMMQPATLTASTCIIRSLDPANYFATTIIFYWKQLQILLPPCSVLAGSSFSFCFHHDGGRRKQLRPAVTTTTGGEGGYRRAHRGGTFRLGASLIHGSALEVFFFKKEDAW